MTTLLSLLLDKGINTVIYSDYFPESFPVNLRPYARLSLPQRGEICIRDMRDSSIEDIKRLKMIFELIFTVDDSGPGDTISDQSIKLLPTPDYILDSKLYNIPFLYGYSFYSEIKTSRGKIEKDIFLSVYSDKLDKYKFDLSKLHNDLKYVVFNGDRKFTKNITVKNNTSYSQIILRSQFVISHFGITLFEASLCGAQPIAINPTHYHKILADNTKNINLINCGLYDEIDYTLLQNTLTKKTQCKILNIESIKELLNTQAKNFLQLIEKD
jgi:hypothetical protein